MHYDLIAIGCIIIGIYLYLKKYNLKCTIFFHFYISISILYRFFKKMKANRKFYRILVIFCNSNINKIHIYSILLLLLLYKTNENICPIYVFVYFIAIQLIKRYFITLIIFVDLIYF